MHYNLQRLWFQQLMVNAAVELPDCAKEKQNPKIKSGVLQYWGLNVSHIAPNKLSVMRVTHLTGQWQNK